MDEMNVTTLEGKDAIYVDAEETYNKKIQSEPKPGREIGIDTENKFLDTFIAAADSDQLDVSAINRFTQVSQSRDSVFALVDTMCEDSTVSAVLETYAEDATETNDDGRIVWAESSNVDVSKYVNYLLESMGVDKNVYNWVSSLCKYGDVYLRLYRESDYEKDNLFSGKKQKSGRPGLQEDINVKAHSEADHYVHYLEKADNPAEVFELQKFGKTYAYIVAPVNAPAATASNKTMYQQALDVYSYKKKDIDIYEPTDYVHGCLEDNSSRTPEYVSIFMTEDEKGEKVTYKVKRGQSLFYNIFKTWRELELLQNSVLLNRITKSSVVRAIQVEVGDMPKEETITYMQRIKQLFEQKSAFDVNNSMNEYTNPGPVENNVYIPTRQQQGNLSIQNVGGDLNVGQLTDLEYFRDRLFGGLRVPKQYFGYTDDGAGFNGGQSLSIISSRYAKMVKRIQATICQMLTDAINLLLIDKGLNNYVNEFSLHMVAPTTQEEIDRRDNISNKIRLVGDVMGMLNDVEDPKARLVILKSLLSDALVNSEVSEVIQQEIDKLEENGNSAVTEEITDDFSDIDSDVSFDDEPIDLGSDLGITPPANNDETFDDLDTDTSNVLPSGQDLGIDLTDSSNDQFN